LGNCGALLRRTGEAPVPTQFEVVENTTADQSKVQRWETESK